MKNITLIFFVSLSFIYCKQPREKFLVTEEISSVKNNEYLENKIDSLEKLLSGLKTKMAWVKKENPTVIIENVKTNNSDLLVFHPFGLNIQLQHVSPSISISNFLCIPAAFTSIQNQVDGLFIEKGVVVNEIINNELTGACIISKDSIQIISFQDINEDLIAQLKSTKKSVFQQMLLVENKEIVQCNLFNGRRNLRRALVRFKGLHRIVQSERQVTIKEFQESLVEIGVVNAVYLDMGTWSEGWYKNNNCEIIRIGETMINTDRQTSWLIYSCN